MLTDDQKSTRLDISRYLLSRYEDDPGDFINRVIAQEDTWVHHFGPESKMQSKQWKHTGSPLLRKGYMLFWPPLEPKIFTNSI